MPRHNKAKIAARILLLGTKPDKEIANEEGVDHSTITAHRKKLGIPKYSNIPELKEKILIYLKENPTKVSVQYIIHNICSILCKNRISKKYILQFANDHNLNIRFLRSPKECDYSILGKLPDPAVAKKWGTSVGYVQSCRRKAGIAAYKIEKNPERKLLKYLKENPSNIVIKNIKEKIGSIDACLLTKNNLKRIAKINNLEISFKFSNKGHALNDSPKCCFGYTCEKCKVTQRIKIRFRKKGIILKRKYLNMFVNNLCDLYNQDTSQRKVLVYGQIDKQLTPDMILKRIVQNRATHLDDIDLPKFL